MSIGQYNPKIRKRRTLLCRLNNQKWQVDTRIYILWYIMFSEGYSYNVAFQSKTLITLVKGVMAQPRSQGPLSSYLEKVPGWGWSRVYVYKSNPHWGWVFDLIVSKLSTKEKVALPHRRYFES